MKAVILAAGRGTRMGDLTAEVPKPMLAVRGRPILEWIVDGLASAGVREICFITGWRAEVIENHFCEGTAMGMRFNYVRQEVANGTGKAPELARDFVGTDPFILCYGDILVRPETYQRLCARWNEGDFSGLVTVTSGEDVSKGGLLFFDEAFNLRHLVEKPSLHEQEGLRRDGWIKAGEPVWYNAGIYVFKPCLFEHTAKLTPSVRGEYELTDALTRLVEAGHVIGGFELKGQWVDVRDPQVLGSVRAGDKSNGE